MKATKHSQPQNLRSLYEPQRGVLAETVVFVTLGLVGLITVFIAVGSASLPKVAKGNPVIRYVRSGIMLSDARSLAAMVRYLLQPEDVSLTNLPDPQLLNGFLAEQ
jgi:hypothetical protein